MIYVYDTLSSSAEGLLKIGWTERDSATRLREQQTGNPEPFRLLMEFDSTTPQGVRITDRMVHAALARQGVERAMGEWFRCPLSTVRSAVLGLETGQDLDPGRFGRRPLRPDQEDAVAHALEASGAGERASWRVAPGFGAVEAALEWARRSGPRRILVTSEDPGPWREALAQRVSLQGLSRAGAIVFSPVEGIEAEIALDCAPLTQAPGLDIVTASLRDAGGGWQQDIFDRLQAMSAVERISDWSWFGFPLIDYQIRRGATPLFEGDGVGRDVRTALCDLIGPDPAWDRLAVRATPEREAALSTWLDLHLDPAVRGNVIAGESVTDAVALLDPDLDLAAWAEALAQALLPQVREIGNGVRVAGCARVTIIDPYPARAARMLARLEKTRGAGVRKIFPAVA